MTCELLYDTEYSGRCVTLTHDGVGRNRNVARGDQTPWHPPQLVCGSRPKRVRHPCNSDVAALAISLANLARTRQATLAPNDIERALDIRTDFGRVAQAFPLDKALFHDRLNFRETLREVALAGAHQLVIGPPGAGKSWELTRLANELREAGAKVARHYCYLEPGDELVKRCVTTDVFFTPVCGR